MVGCRVDLRHDLPGFDGRVVVGKELLDIAGNLAAHLHVQHGIQRARGRDSLCDVTPRDGDRLVVDLIGAAVVPIPPTASARQEQEQEQ